MKKIENKKLMISVIINILVFILVVSASFMMYNGIKFMHGYDPVLNATKFSMFKFFTVLSNIFIGITSLVFAIEEIKILLGKKEKISKRNYILKLMSTTSVGLTFLVVFAYLGPISKGGIASMLMNSNLFFHCIIPLAGIVNFIFFEKTDELKFKNNIYGMVPTGLYGIYYLTNIFIHMENGRVSPMYDWYWFVQGGVWMALIIVPLMLGVSYAISVLIWKLNRIK